MAWRPRPEARQAIDHPDLTGGAPEEAWPHFTGWASGLVQAQDAIFQPARVLVSAKVGLMIEFDRRVVRDIPDRLDRPNLPLRAKLDAVQAAVFAAWTQAHPSLRALGRDYLASTAISEMGRVVAGVSDIVTTILQEGIEAGEVDTDMPASLLSALFVTSVRIAVAHTLSAPPSPARNGPGLAALFLDGCARRTEDPAPSASR